ncbi:DUF1801 domain-containing protein [Sphingobacterium suaedae]|uniref:DUF1801 domain-containing protein n=1 Tax=Sphingobacterium suaedae TaxID=1686402 RepID=A0ABW5KBP5_9SPHI
MIHPDTYRYNEQQPPEDQGICSTLSTLIDQYLPGAENKIWHAHPVWFINGNPIVGYSKLKSGIRLLFWSGQSFGEKKLHQEGKFKAAEIKYTDMREINELEMKRWLAKSAYIQWDYKNLVKRKGVLQPLFAQST